MRVCSTVHVLQVPGMMAMDGPILRKLPHASCVDKRWAGDGGNSESKGAPPTLTLSVDMHQALMSLSIAPMLACSSGIPWP